MLKANRSLNKLLSKCTQIEYKVSPVPSTLTEGMTLYNHFAKYNLVHYYQEQCPVTKMRLGWIKLIVHDKQRLDTQNTHNVSITRGIKDGELSDVERELVDTTQVGDYTLSAEYLTRNVDKITQKRDNQYADHFRTSGPDKLQKAESIATEKLQGISGFYD